MRLVVIGSLALLCACGARSAPPAPQPVFAPGSAAPKPAPQTRRDIAFTALKGAFHATVRATKPPRVTGDDQSTIEIEEAHVTCKLHATVEPAADVARRLLAQRGPAPARPIDIEVGAGSGRPILAVSAVIEGGRATTITVSTLGRGTIACAQDETDLGREQAFRRMIDEIVTSARFGDAPEAPPRYEEIGLLGHDGRRVGMYQRRVVAEGKTRRELKRIAMLAGDAEGWSSVDGGYEALLDAESHVAELTTTYLRDGKSVLASKLTRSPAGEYAFEVTKEGTTKTGTFKPPAPITTDVTRAPEMLAVVAGALQEGRFYTYDPQVSSTDASLVIVHLDGGRVVNFGAKRSSHDCLIDAHGICAKESSKELDWLRLFARGAP
jgi:hypothetical protein